MEPVSAWLKPRSRWLVWPVLLLGFAASFAAGTVLAPERVETRTEFIETVRKVQVKTKAKEVTRYVRITTLPDGTKTEERSEREALKVDTTTKTDTETSSQTTSTPAQKSWAVGALVGATWKEPAIAPSALSVGALGDFRLGKTPCFAGGWGLLELRAGAVTQGTLGVSGRCEF